MVATTNSLRRAKRRAQEGQSRRSSGPGRTDGEPKPSTRAVPDGKAEFRRESTTTSVVLRPSQRAVRFPRSIQERAREKGAQENPGTANAHWRPLGSRILRADRKPPQDFATRVPKESKQQIRCVPLQDLAVILEQTRSGPNIQPTRMGTGYSLARILVGEY